MTADTTPDTGQRTPDGADVDLLTPVTLGDLELPNRVLMAPLTRSRVDEETRTPGEMNVDYYRQRAGAGLVITEATVIPREGIGYVRTPGIWSDRQVDGWRAVTDAVHEQGGRIAVQLWHVGRVSHAAFHDDEPPVSSVATATGTQVYTPDGFEDASIPRALETDEVPRLLDEYRAAACRAMAAGFDAVEVHATNGYLLEQFLASGLNDRDDLYGGSIQARARLLLEVVDAVAEEVDHGRIGIRLSLGNDTAGAEEPDPAPMLTHLATALPQDLAWLHLVERFRGAGSTEEQVDDRTTLLREATDIPLVANGDYDRARGDAALAAGRVDAIAFGRRFLANPDLVERFRLGAELNPWDDDTFYQGGPSGYVDYPTLAQLEHGAHVPGTTDAAA